MTAGDFLRDATQRLRAAGIESARLDVLILLEDALDKDRSSLLAHPEIELSADQLASLNTSIAQRQTHQPLAYNRGKTMFFGREFTVNEHTLIPRPETEAIIELLKEIDLPAGVRIADVGTGSGCIAITTALEVPDAHVWASDTSKAALQIAIRNAARYKASVSFSNCDLLDTEAEFDIILANLPYVPTDYPINQDAAFEPKDAIFSGEDGLGHYRRLWKQLAGRAQKPTDVITESLTSQHASTKLLAEEIGYELVRTLGLAQHFITVR